MGFKNHFFLAQRLKLGDSKAYDFLMEDFYQNLCLYSYSLIHDHEKAEDIVQNVFVELYVKRTNINPKLSLKNYLYRSVYNGFIDQYRKNKPVINLEKKYLEALDHVVENDSENLEELLGKLQQEIDSLPKKCKQIFLLNKKEGLTHIEISEYLGVSIKTIEGHMTRAFKILNKKLGAKMDALLFLLFKF
ncbi:RNA polymerase sigma factor [Maribacter sp. ACAM166]|uniref:RNA polymerase sigma factor n=1 Tax=Maribacter sp. ACAM166 TaxID=2508996 RepID=UPI0010FF3698|nr:sigma-70 family RNA polymerase sigma factor [Maribacter sp. ACAM166]TLP80115.1 sigma-70 family RNA polymerase sigma factor [Maribacter sp. ACAM166]